MIRRIAIILSVIAVLIPFGINLMGHNIYLYITFGEKDLVLAAANGVSHNAISEHLEEPEYSYDLGLNEDFTKTLFEVGPFQVFTEPNGGFMSPFTFNWIEPDPTFYYAGFEFPWLLLLLIPVIILAMPRGSSQVE